MMEHFYHQPIKKKSKRRRVLIGLIVFIAILGIFFWYKYSQYQYYLQTPIDPTDSSNTSIMIKKWSPDSGEDQITNLAKKLQDQNLIIDADTFNWYVKLNHFDRKLVAGRFLIQRSMTIPEIVKVITDIKNGEIVLTIPEGATIKEIDSKLVGFDVIKAGEFMQATKDFNAYEKYPFLNKETLRSLI